MYKTDPEVARREYNKMKGRVVTLYIKRAKAQNPADRRKIANDINAQVMKWHEDYGEEGYLNLHLMTLQGAKHFVAREVARYQGGLLYLETGVGHGSRNKVPVIKEALMKDYAGSIKVCNNEGLLVLYVPKKP